MRTSVVLDDELVEGALQEFVENRKRRNLLDLEGKIKFAKGYDYRNLRGGLQ